MEVQLTRDQQAFAREAVVAGRIQHEGEVIQQALSLWEERERTRLELLTQLHLAEASLLRGEGRDITLGAMQELAGNVKTNESRDLDSLIRR